MNGIARTSLIVAVMLIALTAAASLFVGSGVYNIGADDHHTRIVLALIEQLRDRSIAARARASAVPDLQDSARIVAGADRYALLCAGCHLAPGVNRSEIRTGLYPRPPNLAQEGARDAREQFWTVKHGIKMSAMPAWGKSLDDTAIWDVVAFVRQMPAMSPQAYQQLMQSHSR